MEQQQLIDTFFDLVRIDSPSHSEAKVAAYCKEKLASLGFEVAFDDTEEVTGSDTGNLIAHLPGTVPGHIAFSAHMDCVPPCEGVEPVIREGIVFSAGETILGADDKSGIAAILEALRSVIEEGRARPAITVVFTVCEEVSLVGAKALAADLFPEEVPCFVFDANGHAGTIVYGAPYHYSFSATFEGRAAHAGVEPEMGISAIEVAARAIDSMNLGRIDECTTANIGTVEGGLATNIVADSCRITGECRSLEEAKVLAQRDHMTQAMEDAAARFGAKAEISWGLDYPGVLFDFDDPIITLLRKAAEDAGLEADLIVSGGGADANVLGTKGALAVTLGTGMTAFHTTDESISIADLEGSARFAEAIIAAYAR